MTHQTLAVGFAFALAVSYDNATAADCQLPQQPWRIYGVKNESPYNFEYVSLVETNLQNGKKKLSHFIKNIGSSAELPAEWGKGNISPSVIRFGECASSIRETFLETKVDPDSPIKYGIGRSKTENTDAYVKTGTSAAMKLQDAEVLNSSFAINLKDADSTIRVNLTISSEIKGGAFSYRIRNNGGNDIKVALPELTTQLSRYAPEQLKDWIRAGQSQMLNLKPASPWTCSIAERVTEFSERAVRIEIISPKDGRVLPAGVASLYLPQNR